MARKFPEDTQYTRDYLLYHSENRVVKHTSIKSFKVFENMHRNLLLWDFLPKNKDSFYLDLGCGRAPNTIALALDGRKVIGADLDPKELGPAQQWVKANKLEKYATLQRENMNKLTFKNNTFDYIVCIEALEHTEDMRIAGAEITRVLKNNGTAIISLPNSTSIMWKLIHLCKHLRSYSCPNIEYGREFHHELPLRHIYKLIKDLNLEVEDMRSLNILPLPMVYNFLPNTLTPLILRFSYWWRKFDALLGRTPVVKIFGSSVILKCKKITSKNTNEKVNKENEKRSEK